MEDHSARPRVRNLLLAGAHLLLTLGVLALPAHLRPLWPALVALVMVFATRSATLSLGTACLAALILLGVPHGEVLQQWFAPEGGLLNTLNSPWHRGALIFTLLLGSFAAVVERSGGLLPLLRAEGEVNDRTRKRFLTSVFGLGLVCFFDGLANALMIGRVARPVADRLLRSAAGSILAAALVGAATVLVSDFVAVELLPFEPPTGVVTGAIGAPYLLWLLATTNRRGLGG